MATLYTFPSSGSCRACSCSLCSRCHSSVGSLRAAADDAGVPPPPLDRSAASTCAALSCRPSRGVMRSAGPLVPPSLLARLNVSLTIGRVEAASMELPSAANGAPPSELLARAPSPLTPSSVALALAPSAALSAGLAPLGAAALSADSASARRRCPPPRVPRFVLRQLCSTTPFSSTQPMTLALMATFVAVGGGTNSAPELSCTTHSHPSAYLSHTYKAAADTSKELRWAVGARQRVLLRAHLVAVQRAGHAGVHARARRGAGRRPSAVVGRRMHGLSKGAAVDERRGMVRCRRRLPGQEVRRRWRRRRRREALVVRRRVAMSAAGAAVAMRWY